jgi:hypothetical protein
VVTHQHQPDAGGLLQQAQLFERFRAQMVRFVNDDKALSAIKTAAQCAGQRTLRRGASFIPSS